MTIKIDGFTTQEEGSHALRVAHDFAGEFPERVGRENGVCYAASGERATFYAYRTPAGMIVVVPA